MKTKLMNFVWIVSFASTGMAQDRPTTLPADGAWVRYHCTVKSDDGKQDRTLKTSIRLVGTKTENNQRCRWVELENDDRQGNEGTDQIYKLLFPEHSLLSDERPLRHVLKCWNRVDPGEIKELKTSALSESGGGNTRILDGSMLFWPGMLKDARPVHESTIVDYQQGKLEIPSGLTGKYVAVYDNAANPSLSLVSSSEYRVWFHKSLPVGYGHAKIRSTLDQNEKRILGSHREYFAEAWGMDAKTQIPEHD